MYDCKVVRTTKSVLVTGSTASQLFAQLAPQSQYTPLIVTRDADSGYANDYREAIQALLS
jgi:hypothetical protein